MWQKFSMFVYLPLYRITYSLDQNLMLMHIYQVEKKLKSFRVLTAEFVKFSATELKRKL